METDITVYVNSKSTGMLDAEDIASEASVRKIFWGATLQQLVRWQINDEYKGTEKEVVVA